MPIWLAVLTAFIIFLEFPDVDKANKISPFWPIADICLENIDSNP